MTEYSTILSTVTAWWGLIAGLLCRKAKTKVVSCFSFWLTIPVALMCCRILESCTMTCCWGAEEQHTCKAHGYDPLIKMTDIRCLQRHSVTLSVLANLAVVAVEAGWLAGPALAGPPAELVGPAAAVAVQPAEPSAPQYRSPPLPLTAVVCFPIAEIWRGGKKKLINVK